MQLRSPHDIPWEFIFFELPCLQHILSCLLLHPTDWDRQKHFDKVACDGHTCRCCRSRWMFFEEPGDGCDACRTAWLLSTLCKNMLHHVQEFNATCSCGSCEKRWMAMGWQCPSNPWKGCYRGRGWYFCLCLSGADGNATPESQEAHSPRASPVSFPSPITYSYNEEYSDEEQHEDEQVLA